MKKYWMIILPIALSGCLLESIGRIDRNIKPYGAHWIKEGMTREGRREDSWTCGAAETVYAADHVVFTTEQREKIRLPVDKSNFEPDERLLDQWRACMKAKGYVQLPIGSCDARCMHP